MTPAPVLPPGAGACHVLRESAVKAGLRQARTPFPPAARSALGRLHPAMPHARPAGKTPQNSRVLLQDRACRSRLSPAGPAQAKGAFHGPCPGSGSLAQAPPACWTPRASSAAPFTGCPVFASFPHIRLLPGQRARPACGSPPAPRASRSSLPANRQAPFDGHLLPPIVPSIFQPPIPWRCSPTRKDSAQAEAKQVQRRHTEGNSLI